MSILFRAIVFAFSLISLACIAKPTDNTAEVRAILQKQFPELPALNITPSPVAGLYLATAGAQVFYVSKEGRYIVSGEMIDLQQSQKNLTENARKTARLDALKTVNNDEMIIFSPQKPQYTITVFTDVDCGYCKKLQSEMDDINARGIAVRYVAFPRTGPNTPTFDKMLKIWCAKDKKLALRQATQNQALSNTTCTSDVLLKQFELGMRMGISGTPSIVFEDGTLLPGYLPPEKLLDAVKKIRTQ